MHLFKSLGTLVLGIWIMGSQQVLATNATCETAQNRAGCLKAFAQLDEKATVFYLGHFGIKRLYTEDLNGKTFPQVRSLTLSRPEDKNSLIEVSPDFVQQFPNVEDVTIWKSGLKQLPVEFFQNLPKLRYINLMMSRLTILKAEQFKGSNAIEILNIDHNNLHTIESGVFDNLTELRSLELDSNHEIPDGAYLTSLPKDLLRNNKKLWELDLDCNGLVELPKDFFAGLDQLCSIDIKGNNIEEFSKELFKDQPSRDACSAMGKPYIRETVGNPGSHPEGYRKCPMIWDDLRGEWVTKKEWKASTRN